MNAKLEWIQCCTYTMVTFILLYSVMHNLSGRKRWGLLAHVSEVNYSYIKFKLQPRIND